MSSIPVRRVSRQDIQLVQNLIERCLQLYMNQKEVVETLLEQAKIEPGFTELVWQKLEEENQEFFKAYYLRLLLKKQIIEFNDLLLKQVRLTNQLRSQVAPLPTSNGPYISQLHQNPAGCAAGHRPENIQHPIGSGLPNVYNNGGLPNVYNNGESSHRTRMLATAEISAHTNAIDGPPNFISAQSSNMGMVQGINGSLIKSESLYSGNSPYMFGADGNVLETRPTIGDASVTPFTNVESNAHPLNDSPLDLDTSAFGYLGQIRRNFSLSDLAADFTQSSGILESYTRSPFVATDTQNFFDSRERGVQVVNNKLNSMSESLGFEGFGRE